MAHGIHVVFSSNMHCDFADDQHVFHIADMSYRGGIHFISESFHIADQPGSAKGPHYETTPSFTLGIRVREARAFLYQPRLPPLIQPNSLKVEIDFLQNVLLPPQTLAYHNVWGLDFTVAVMDIKEICAEKIRAMSDRARYRDFYDIYLLMEKYQLDLDEVVTCVKQKEIRRPITKASIQTNWQVIATEKEQEMDQIYYSKQVEDSQIEKLITSLPFDSITAKYLLAI